MNDKPHHILKQFREKNHTIALLMEEDPEFLALCEDYDVCIEAMRHWEQSREPEAETRVKEYRSLSQELEEEITQTLAALKPGRLE